MMLLRGAYVAALRLERREGDVKPADLQNALAQLNAADLSKVFGEMQGRDALRIRRITHESPLEIVLCGALSSMCAVYLLIGGKFKVGVTGVSGELPFGLVELIARLKDLFSKKTRTTVGYGATDRRVKLRKEEYEELMKHDPSTRSRGGFQRFLIGLQFRVDHRTRELTLSASEIDIILKHGSQPHVGSGKSDALIPESLAS
jgi:hypothetical protein